MWRNELRCSWKDCCIGSHFRASSSADAEVAVKESDIAGFGTCHVDFDYYYARKNVCTSKDEICKLCKADVTE